MLTTVQEKNIPICSTQELREYLTMLANAIREYRNRTSQEPSSKQKQGLSFKNPETGEEEPRPIPVIPKDVDEKAFIDFLGQQDIDCLTRAIEIVLDHRIEKLIPPRSKRTYGHQEYIFALKKFYEKGLSISEIAHFLDLEWKKVRDMLSLKKLLTDIEHEMLKILSVRIAEWGNTYGNPVKTLQPEQLFEILKEYTKDLFDEAKQELYNSKERFKKSLVAQLIRRYLKNLEG